MCVKQVQSERVTQLLDSCNPPTVVGDLVGPFFTHFQLYYLWAIVLFNCLPFPPPPFKMVSTGAGIVQIQVIWWGFWLRSQQKHLPVWLSRRPERLKALFRTHTCTEKPSKPSSDAAETSRGEEPCSQRSQRDTQLFPCAFDILASSVKYGTLDLSPETGSAVLLHKTLFSQSSLLSLQSDSWPLRL